MVSQLPSSLDNLSKAELVEHLQSEREKSNALFRLVASMLHDYRAPLANIGGYTRLLLSPQLNELAPLNQTQQKFVQSINAIADRLIKSQEFYSLALRTVQLIHEWPSHEKIILAELEILEQLTPNNLYSLPAVEIPRQAFLTLVDLLTFIKSDELELSFAVDGDWVQVSSANFENRPYWFERSLDPATGRLKYKESAAGFEPLGHIVALVEKNGGTVFAELDGESTFGLSFTLPVYKEAS
ncbi:MAG: HAMP domain-containing histidine kinase [Anaerolineae bacterium]|nr:HAMP domain-containing histidine kinase [Anaerolineae bacterium]